MLDPSFPVISSHLVTAGNSIVRSKQKRTITIEVNKEITNHWVQSLEAISAYCLINGIVKVQVTTMLPPECPALWPVQVSVWLNSICLYSSVLLSLSRTGRSWVWYFETYQHWMWLGCIMYVQVQEGVNPRCALCSRSCDFSFPYSFGTFSAAFLFHIFSRDFNTLDIRKEIIGEGPSSASYSGWQKDFLL